METDADTTLDVLAHIDTALSALRARERWYRVHQYRASDKTTASARKRLKNRKQLLESIAFWEQVRELHVQGKS